MTGDGPSSGRRGKWLGPTLALAAGCAAVAIVAVAAGGDGGSSSSSVPRGEAAVLHPDGATMGATWAFRPKSVQGLVDRAKMGGVASVERIAAGPPLRGDEPDDVTPTQRITFRFDEQWFGSGPAEFVLYKTGSNSHWIEHDPPYAIGERYVMFVSPRPGDPGTYLNVAPDGRLKVQDGRIRPLIEGAVAKRLGGANLAAAEQTAESVRGR